jgi:hypothetical protein
LKNNNGFEAKSQIKIIVKYMSIIKKIMFKVCQNKKNDLVIRNVCRICTTKGEDFDEVMPIVQVCISKHS